MEILTLSLSDKIFRVRRGASTEVHREKKLQLETLLIEGFHALDDTEVEEEQVKIKGLLLLGARKLAAVEKVLRQR